MHEIGPLHAIVLAASFVAIFGACAAQMAGL